MSIIWNINGTAYGHNNIIQLGIVTNGGPQQSNLTITGYSLSITGYPLYNNTEVICIASGVVDGNRYSNKSELAILRIQGNTLSDICHYISSH